MKKKISLSFDVISKHRTLLMGIAILSIILFHFTEDCVNYKYNLKPFIVNYKKCVGSSGVDIFLFLSGLGLYYSFKKNSDKKAFFRKRFSRILIPYFIVSIPAWYARDILIFKTEIVQYFKDLFYVSFFEKGLVWFWYILMISICYLIFPYIFEYIDGSNSVTKMMNIFIFITVIAIMLDLYNNALFLKINIALLRFPAFFLGCFIGKLSWNHKPLPKETLFIPILTLLLYSMKDSSKILLTRYIYGLFGIVMIVCLAVLFECLDNICSWRLYKWIKKIICWFGDYSLELYLTHVAIRGIMTWCNFPTYRIRYECVMIALSVISSILVKRLTNLLLKLIVSRKHS